MKPEKVGLIILLILLAIVCGLGVAAGGLVTGLVVAANT